MKRKNSVIIFVLLLLVLVAGYIVVTAVTTKRQGFSEQDGGIAVSALRQSSIAEMRYRVGEEEFDFYTDTAGKWYYRPDTGFPVNAQIMTGMTALLSKVNASREISGGEVDLEEFGLVSPTLHITITDKSDKETVYKVGAYNSFTNEYYFMLGESDRVYTIGPELAQGFSRKLVELALVDAAPEIDKDAYKMFTIYSGEKKTRFQFLRDGQDHFYTDMYNWFIIEPYDFAAAGTAKMNYLVSKATSNFEMAACADYKPSDEALEAYGLVLPRAKAIIDYTVTKTVGTSMTGAAATVVEDMSYSLLIGAQRDEEFTYVMIEGSDTVGLVLTEDVSVFIDLDAHDYLPVEIMLMDILTVERMDVVLDGKTHTVKMNAKSGQEPQNGEIAYTIDGREADAYCVEEFFKTIRMLTSESLATKEITDKPSVSVTFYRNTDNFKLMTIDFFPYDLNFYLVEFNGRREQLVNKRNVEKMTELFFMALG